MKIFNWMQSKLTGIPQTKKPNLELFDDHQKVQQPLKEDQPISEWPHGFLTIGTLGNNDFKEDHQHASPPPSPRDPLHDITPEEATRLQNELNSFLNEQEVDPSNYSASELAGKFLNRQTNLKLAEKNSINATESDEPKGNLNSRFQLSGNMVYSRGKDANCLENTNTVIGKKSLSFLLKKMFLRRSGFSPPIAAPGLKDPIPESRMEKILRAILLKKIYPQQSSNSTLSMNKYLENTNKTKSFTANEEKLNNKRDDSDSDDDGSKWDKTDSEYIVLEI